MAFQDKTRQNIRPLDSVLTYSDNGRSVARFPRTGLLARAYIQVRGNMNVAKGTGTVALSPKGPWNLVRSLHIKANQGMEIVRLSGHFAHILDTISAGKMYEPDDGQRVSDFTSDVFAAGVADGDNAWAFNVCLNITPNDRDLVGLLLLQTDQMAAELEINWAPAGSASIDSPIVTTGDATASFSGSAKVSLETFTVPGDPADRPDLTMVYQQLERVDPITNIGENRIDLLRANAYARIAHMVEINGQPAGDDITRMSLRYNNADTPYELNRDTFLHLQRRRYGRDLPAGVFVWDLYYQGIPGFGGTRDLINAGTVAEFASLVDVASSATIGSGNNYLRTATQQFVQLGTPMQ